MENRNIQVFKPLIHQSAKEAVVKVLDSGWIGLGPKTSEFEESFAKYVGCKHAIALNSCTSALHIALILSDVKKGQMVFTTPLTFVSTNLVIKYIGAIPVFVDVLDDGNMDPIDLKNKINKYRLKDLGAIIVVHFGGYPNDLEAIYDISTDEGLQIIEDCAHACGSTYRGTKIGNTELCCFSFQAVKNLPIGDGGMLTFNNTDLLERARRLRWCGIDKSTFNRSAETGEYLWHYEVPEVGYKYHMNDINAAIGIEQLKYLDNDNSLRLLIANRYRREFKDIKGISFPQYSQDRKSSHHFLPALINNRDMVLKMLRARGIHCGVHYRLNYRYDAFSEQADACPNADKIEKRLLTLPMHLLLTYEDISYIIKNVKEVLGEVC